jgi:hypothetical protein
MQTYPMKVLWFSMFLGWVFKTVIVKYGGVRGLVTTVPFLLGLAFGASSPWWCGW